VSADSYGAKDDFSSAKRLNMHHLFELGMLIMGFFFQFKMKHKTFCCGKEHLG
jgi:hypothetical protein